MPAPLRARAQAGRPLQVPLELLEVSYVHWQTAQLELEADPAAAVEGPWPLV